VTTTTVGRKPRATRLRSIPDGVEFVVTQFPEPAAEVRAVLAGIGTSPAEGRRVILDAGLLLLRLAREQGITQITDIDRMLAAPGAVRVNAGKAR